MLLRTRRGLIEFGRARLQPRDAVARVVNEIALSPGGLRYLHRALIDASPAPVPEDISSTDLLAQVIARVVDGSLAFVFLRPQDTAAPAFVVQGEGAVVAAENKNKAGDLKPAPEVPPSYPILARAESDQVVDSTAKLNAKLTALMFGTFARGSRPSTIARTLVTTASEQAQRIQSARQTTDISLEVGKWPGGGLDRVKPEVPIEYKSAAQSTGQMAKVAIDKLSASLGPNDPSKTGRPAASIPETFVQVASGTADGTKSAIVSLGSSFAAMFRHEPFVRPRNTAAASDEGG
jgi:hypothetical protein